MMRASRWSCITGPMRISTCSTWTRAARSLLISVLDDPAATERQTAEARKLLDLTDQNQQTLNFYISENVIGKKVSEALNSLKIDSNETFVPLIEQRGKTQEDVIREAVTKFKE